MSTAIILSFIRPDGVGEPYALHTLHLKSVNVVGIISRRNMGSTVNKEKAPWESYNACFEEKLDPKLEEEVKRYSEKRHEKSSSQNEEELARQKEINYELASQYRWVSPEEYADQGPRIGRIMHSSELITLLRKKCGMQCWYRDHPQPRKVTLVAKRDYAEPEVGCWVQQGYMPEYTIMDFDEHGVPLAEKFRGWRTCVLQLILKGLITEEQANKVFGCAYGPVSERYLNTLYGFRNRSFAVV